MPLSPNPHSQATLMFHDGLALLLIEKSVLLKAQVVEIIRGIIEVKQKVAGVSGSVVVGVASIGLLQTIARSIAAAPLPPPFVPA